MIESTEGGFRRQIEAALGRPIEIMWESDLQSRIGIRDRAEFRRQFERFTSLLDLDEILAGKLKPSGGIVMVASLQRGGVFVQVRQLNAKR